MYEKHVFSRYRKVFWEILEARAGALLTHPGPRGQEPARLAAHLFAARVAVVTVANRSARHTEGVTGRFKKSNSLTLVRQLDW